MIESFCTRLGTISLVLLAMAGPVAAQETDACNPALIKSMIGQRYSPELAEQARRASGANAVRPVGPGIPSSSDWHEHRLNMELDKKGIVVGLRCG